MEAFLAAHGARFTGLATSAPAGASAALLAALPALRVISSHGVGLDKIDLEVAAQQHDDMISAIEHHDPVLAGEIVRAHLELSRRRMSEYAAPEGLDVPLTF